MSDEQTEVLLMAHGSLLMAHYMNNLLTEVSS
jgi:hypothetical protein